MATIEITVAGETRTLPITSEYGHWGKTEALLAGRIGMGTKVHPMPATLVACPDEAEGARLGYRLGKSLRQDSEGRLWGIQLQTSVLNRQCRAFAWLDKTGTGARSRHINETYA